jgi:hypothetical protein
MFLLRRIMMPINCGRVRRRNLLHPLWVLLDVICATEGDGFHSRFSYFTMPMTEATDVPEQFNVGNVKKRSYQESPRCCSMVSDRL